MLPDFRVLISQLWAVGPPNAPKFLRDEDLNHPEENSGSSMSMASREVPLPGSVWLEFGEKQPQSVFLCAAAFNFRI